LDIILIKKEFSVMYLSNVMFRILLFVLGLILHTQVIGQTNYIPKIIPPSPNQASLLKFIDVPVSPYTGTSDVTIPIVTIQLKGTSVPISLNYHTGGIRLKEEAGWVGLGWALSTGGSISRSIIGKDDFVDSNLSISIPLFHNYPVIYFRVNHRNRPFSHPTLLTFGVDIQ